MAFSLCQMLGTLLLVISLALLVLRVGVVALTMTGVSKEVARFQALSAYAGVGFTTRESERIVEHPVRRRIIRALILLGNMGVVTAVATAILSFLDIQREAPGPRLLLLVGGLALLVAVSRSRAFERRLSKWIEWGLARFTDLDLRDYSALLRLEGAYGVAEIQVEESTWLAGHDLGELKLEDEGVTVLGVVRADGSYLGVPRAGTKLHAGDTLVVYGRDTLLRELAERRLGSAGDRAHAQAARVQRRLDKQELARSSLAGS